MMAWVILVLSVPLLMAPVLVWSDAFISQMADLSRARARALAEYGIARALIRLAADDAYAGTTSTPYAEGRLVFTVVGAGEQRTVTAVAYVPTAQTPRAVARITTHAERTPGSSSWHLVGGRRIVEGAR